MVYVGSVPVTSGVLPRSHKGGWDSDGRAVASNFSVLEWHAIDMPHREDFVRYSGGVVIRDGHIDLTEAPGLGLEHRHDKDGIPFFERE